MRRFVFVLIASVLWLGGAAPAAGLAGPALTVDLTEPTHAISPYIYGMNFADPALAVELNLPLNRWGGNSTSRYDYLTDTSSKGSDWYFANIPYRSEGNQGALLPDESTVNQYIDENNGWGGETIVTVPLIGWMPKAEAYDCSYHIDLYPTQQDYEPYRGDCGNGVLANGTRITGNDPTEASVAIDETFVQTWVAYLVARYGGAGAANGVKFYSLDNEPMLWNDTHRDVRQTPLGYDELVARGIAYAEAVKAADPLAATLGPVGFGVTEYYYSAVDWEPGGAWWSNPVDRNAHDGKPLAEWYLEQMAQYDSDHGVRLLDYFDEHFYPQNGVSLNEDVSTSGIRNLRLRSTRALWDPTYTDESWIADTESPQLMLIPRMKAWVDDNYPGTKTAITEYNWGALGHINGALAQADILGIFGREGLDMAALWAPPGADDPGAYAFRMYLNYDGAGRDFGDVSVNASSADQSKLAVYAATRSTDGALTIIAINKTNDVQTSTLTVSGFEGSAGVDVFRYSPANLGAIVQDVDELFAADQIVHDYPANSITLLVLHPSAIPPSELVANGGFEAEPTDWIFKNPVGDKRKCHDANPGKFANSGICGLKLTGTAGVTTKISQFLATAAGLSGDDIVLIAYAKGKAFAAKATIKAKLTTTAGTQKLKLVLASGTYGYAGTQAVSQLIGDLLSGTVQAVVKPGSGTLFVDDVSLLVYAGGGRGIALSLPAAPAGFRR